MLHGPQKSDTRMLLWSQYYTIVQHTKMDRDARSSSHVPDPSNTTASPVKITNK